MSDDRASLNPRAIVPDAPAAAPSGAAAPPVAAAGGEPDLTGQNLDGRYQVMKRLGEGELSVVYEARHAPSGRHFAVKVLRSSFAAKPGALDRFLQCSRLASQIRHDNVVSIEEFGYTPTGSVYAAVELVVGPTLQAICDQDGRWPWERARPIALQLAAALDAAHRGGVIHRALKPSNCFVILDPRGKREPFVKVADFGLSQVGVEASQGSADATVAALFGDPEYMAPEQGFGGEVGPSCDIYALGLVLYRLLTGRVPFSHANAFQVLSQHANKPVPPPREIDPRIPVALDQVVMRCLGKTPDQRFSTASEVARALEAIPEGAAGAGAAAPGAGSSGQRFAKMRAGGPGGQPGGAPPPRQQPSVIVAGAIGDDDGSAMPSFIDAPPPPSSEMTSSFLASRPGLRMGLGAALPGPGGDDPAPPPTVAPGMAVPTPTMYPGIRAPLAGLDSGGPEGPPPLGGHGSSSSSDPSLPPPVSGGYTPPSGPGPGMPGMGGGYTPPSGPGPGMPGMGGGYTPPSGPGPGMPGMDGGYTPPSGPGPGMPGMDGGYTPPSGPGPGMPMSSGPSLPGLSRDDHDSPDGLRRGVGPGMPPRDPGMGGGMGMRRGMGPGMPPPMESSGPSSMMSSSPSLSDASRGVEAPSALGAVEYDEDEQPKRRPLLIVGIAVAVIAGGAGLGWLIVGGDDGPEGDVAKVTRTGKAQDIDVSPDPVPEPDPEPEPTEVEVETKAKPKPPKPKAELTFEQSLRQLKGRIQSRCKKLGPGPVTVDTFVAKDGGKAIAPKVKPKGPVGTCALRIVEGWSFPGSDQDHPVNESVSW